MMPVRMTAWPETIRVKLSSEAAGAITITPVVVREMPQAELMEVIVGVTGKDIARVREILRRGSLTSGASRFRWEPVEAEEAVIRGALAAFPDPDPSRPFDAARCETAVLLSATLRIEVPREAGAKRRLLRRRSFWDALMEVASQGTPGYVDYLYKERADCYSAAVDGESVRRIREAASRLVYPALARQIESSVFDSLHFHAPR